MIVPGRYFNALTASPWQGQVGAYPGAQPGSNSIIDLMPPQQPPAMQAPAPVQPAVQVGSVPYGPEGGGLGYGDQPAVPSPDQSARGMLGPALTTAGFLAGPFGAFTGLLAGMAFDDFRGTPIGTTMGFTDLALQTVGLPTLGQMMGFTDPAQPGQFGAPGAQFPSDFSDATAMIGQAPPGDPMAGAWGQIAAAGDPNAQLGGLDGAGLAGVLGQAGIQGYAGSDPYAGAWGDIAAGGSPGDAMGAGGGMASAEMGGGYGLGGGEYGGDAFGLRTGGYTGDGPADMPAGPVHKGEGVLNAAAMRHYGDAARLAVAAINARAVPKNRLRDLLPR